MYSRPGKVPNSFISSDIIKFIHHFHYVQTKFLYLVYEKREFSCPLDCCLFVDGINSVLAKETGVKYVLHYRSQMLFGINLLVQTARWSLQFPSTLFISDTIYSFKTNRAIIPKGTEPEISLLVYFIEYSRYQKYVKLNLYVGLSMRSTAYFRSCTTFLQCEPFLREKNYQFDPSFIKQGLYWIETNLNFIETYSLGYTIIITEYDIKIQTHRLRSLNIGTSVQTKDGKYTSQHSECKHNACRKKKKDEYNIYECAHARKHTRTRNT